MTTHKRKVSVAQSDVAHPLASSPADDFSFENAECCGSMGRMLAMKTSSSPHEVTCAPSPSDTSLMPASSPPTLPE
jgi:hypothetical protein